jgi:hypothetical protein
LADVKPKQEAVSLNALGKFMNVCTHSIRKAAGKASDEHPDNKTRLLRFVDSIVEKARALVCPNDAADFYFCVCTHSSHLCARAFIHPQADSNCQLPVAGVHAQNMRPPLSKQSRGKSTLKSIR